MTDQQSTINSRPSTAYEIFKGTIKVAEVEAVSATEALRIARENLGLRCSSAVAKAEN